MGSKEVWEFHCDCAGQLGGCAAKRKLSQVIGVLISSTTTRQGNNNNSNKENSNSNENRNYNKLQCRYIVGGGRGRSRGEGGVERVRKMTAKVL